MNWPDATLGAPAARSVHVLAARAAGPAASGGDGWLFQVLTKLGMGTSSAHTVADLILRPVEIVLIVLVAFVVARYGHKAIRRYLVRVAEHAAKLSGSTRAHSRAITVVGLIGNLWQAIVFVIAVAVILGVIGLDLTPLLASATIIAVTLGFGAQLIVRDYLTGIILTVEDQYGIGDTITIVLASAALTGKVEDISLRVTRLRADDGTVIHVPNGDIRELTNLTRGVAQATVDLPVPRAAVATGEGLDRLHDVLLDAAQGIAEDPRFAGSSTGHPEVVGMVGADADTCTFRIRLRTAAVQRIEVEHALRAALVAATGN